MAHSFPKISLVFEVLTCLYVLMPQFVNAQSKGAPSPTPASQETAPLPELSVILSEAIREGNWKLAKKTADSWIKKSPKSPMAVYISDLSRNVLQEPPKGGTALSTYDFPYSDRMAIQELLSWSDGMLAASPTNENFLIVNAGLYLKGLVDNGRAIEPLEKALDSAPDNVFILSTLGQCYGATGRVDDATRLLQKAIRIDPKCSAAYDGLGMAAMSRGDRAKAEEMFTKATKSGRAGPMSWFNLGSLYYRRYRK